MNAFKTLIKSKKVVVWGITTVVLAALLITATTLCTGMLKNTIAQALGGDEPIYAQGDGGNDKFVADFKTKEEAIANGNAVTREICEEGMVLLKNANGALPLEKNAKVSVFGKNSVNLVYGGSGSASPKPGSVELKTIYDSLTAAGLQCNPTLENFYKDNSASGEPRDGNPAMENGGISSLATGETDISRYTSNITSSYSSYKDAALVVFSRIAGENWDLPRREKNDPTHHYLELDANERALLKHIVDANVFDHIVVLMNSSNYIDLGFLEFEDNPSYSPKIDAAINIGSPGAAGIMALGDILVGNVNPSGHTVDTVYTHYENDPTWQNHGAYLEDNQDAYTVDGQPQAYYFVDYEENIYFGYRYYETRGAEDPVWYNQNVVYPFGHGLSYTDFQHTVVNGTELFLEPLDANTPFDVQVKVQNIGPVAGKDVVQIYASAPYTPGGIEKAHKVLVGFAKTKLLEPQEEETVTIRITPYDFASFDAEDKNGNGFKGYELDQGQYIFYISRNAHEHFDTFTKELPVPARFEKDPETNYEVKPLFEEADDHLQQELSRDDFAGTFPVMPTAADREVTREFINSENDRTHNNPEDLSVMPKMDQPISVKIRELIGLNYNDSKWETFLDQMKFEEMVDLFNKGCYSTTALERLGLPATLSVDGPTGISNFQGNPSIYGTAYYCSETIVAQTYNLSLVEKEATAIGNECLLGNLAVGQPYTGWYAPGVNLHRSPFGGRNTEYYSEDPFLSGKFAGRLIAKVQEKGVYANIKHFALNEGETHRSANGLNTWCKEQAMRELYLKPFEIAIKEGKSLGLMTSFNRIGKRWAGGDYNLCTTVLRKEWGFVGSVICDYHTDAYMDNEMMIYAGGDLNLTTDLFKPWAATRNRRGPEADRASDVNVLRRASHNNLYALVNSNAFRAEVTGYRLPAWQIALYAVDGGVGGALLVWGFLVIFFTLRKKETAPEEKAE